MHPVGISFQKRWLVPSLALLLFGFAVAPTLSRMTCRISGRSTLVVGEARACCPEEGTRLPGAVVKGICCDIFKTDVPKEHYRAEDPAPGMLLAMPGEANVLFQRLELPSPRHAVVHQRPPPLSVVDRLTRCGAFLL